MEEPVVEYSTLTVEELKCEQMFKDSIQQNEDGRLIVKYPLKCEPEVLGDSFKTAKRRFDALERRLNRNEGLKGEYIKFMKEYEVLGHMSLVENSDLHKIRYYAPHQAVLKPESTSTKTRVVFDCSCKTSRNISLNDIQYKGPTIQDNLFSIIFRFRQYKYAITADVSKMYRQIKVTDEDSYLQCILWREDPGEELRTYRLTTVTYGTTSAPFLATRCLKHLAEQFKNGHPKASEKVRNDFYMDDLITGGDTIEEIEMIREQVTQILGSAKLELRKWYCNNKFILQEIPESERETPLRINDSDIIKTLGIVWNPEKDEFCYTVPEFREAKCLTKRIVLAHTAQLFDPLGLINLIVVKAKIFNQELWKLSLKWDDPLPMSHHTLWIKYIEELKTINSIKVPRYVMCDKMKQVQIHGFADASSKAYGCCIYIRCVKEDGQVKINLLAAKSRVAPVVSRSLPCLELSAVLLLAELWVSIKSNIRCEVDEVIFWTDSEIVLCWLASIPSTWNTFVGNRVAKVQQICKDVVEWRHVNSSNNPADIVSRGSSVSELQNSMWFTGPQFLKEESTKWPKIKKFQGLEFDIERKQNKLCLMTRVEDKFAENYTSIRTNDISKVLTRFAFVLRFIQNLKNRIGYRSIESLEVNETPFIPTTKELSMAMHRIVWHIQQQHFTDEIMNLEKNKYVNNNSILKNMNPFLEEEDGVRLLKVGGRLEQSDVPYAAKHPIILPKDNAWVKNYVKFIHLSNLHAGQQALAAFVKQKFWIVNLKTLADQVVNGCVHCVRYKPKLLKQMMGNLPRSRITEAKAFTRSGVDFCGPINITLRIRGRPPVKVYVAVFVCFTTKAVHLEIVSDLSTEAFLAALKRFIGRRGIPQHLFCDNGTNFVGARRILYELQQQFLGKKNQDQIASWCVNHGIQFHQIPPRAPHFGGLWEAAVKSAKKLLMKIIGPTKLTSEELNTFVVQVEAILNSRPIVSMSSNPSDLEALTPGHFLVGGPLNAIAEPTVNANAVLHTNRWRFVTRLQQHFWERWHKEYLCELQARKKWFLSSENIQVNQIVLISESNVPPQQWFMGRIVKIIEGDDGRVRVVHVKTKKGVSERVVHRLAPLPVEVESSTQDNSTGPGC